MAHLRWKNEEMHSSEKTWGICAIILTGLTVSLLYHSFIGYVIGAGYPSNTFFFDPSLIFSDFFLIFRGVQEGSPLSWNEAVYFPFAYAPLYLLAWMHPVAAFVTTVAVFSALTFWFVWKHLEFLAVWRRTAAALTLSFATYPFLFCVNRGNLEMILLLFLLGFFVCIQHGRYLIAGGLLAGATAMKLYPGAFGVLLLQRRRYKASALAAALTLAFTGVSAAAYPGGVSGTFKMLANNLQFFRDEYIFSAGTLHFSTSYFSLIKLGARLTGGDVSRFAHTMHLPYVLFCMVVFALVVLYIIKCEKVLWKQVALLAFMTILLPEVTFDYKLIHLLVPAVLFISTSPGKAGEDRLYMWLFGLLFIPKAYAPIGYETTIGVLLNPLLMTAMMGTIVWRGIRRTPAPEA